MLDPAVCLRALATRDARFDGRFFTCVRTTGVYCRPVCPARTPLATNVTFVEHPAAAEAAGFRPCRRCRPDAAPWTPAWDGTGATVSRGLRLIDEGAMEDGGAARLAARLGVGERHLRRLFLRHVGATPARIERTRRVHLARTFVEETSLPLTRVAFESGFASVRRFNEAFRASFERSPTEMRLARGPRSADAPLALRLAYRPPYDWPALARFLARRALPGVEVVDETAYVRSHLVGDRPGAVRVTPIADERALRVELFGARPPLASVARRLRRMFDLDADPEAVAARLSADARLRPLVDARPGLRIAGAWDAYEAAVRAVLGQQVSAVAGFRLCGRVAERFGASIEPLAGAVRLFPEPDVLADADVGPLGVPRARAETLRAVAAAFAAGKVPRDGPVDAADAAARLTSIPGVGPWTAQYVAMRGYGDPDAFLAGDVALRNALDADAPPSERELARIAESWRPWRGYATLHLWTGVPAEKETACASK